MFPVKNSPKENFSREKSQHLPKDCIDNINPGKYFLWTILLNI